MREIISKAENASVLEWASNLLETQDITIY